ncbi:MAG TPA: N-acetylmuramoyl-L-alanine amidase [Gammaproteobacteria bacterium]|jgi:N-acetyl-anhydromuramyl-L-alanine amidase AmpD
MDQRRKNRRKLRALRIGLAAAGLVALAACGPLRFVDVLAETQTSRIDHLVIHFTGENYAESMRLLTQRTEAPVSAHYLVPAPGDPAYPRRRLRVHRLVDERQRAWHAGESYWDDATELNARSIGIEIVNESRCLDIDPDLEPNTPENQRCVFRDFDPEQIELVIALARDILDRYPEMDPEDVVGHADIAPERRVDPGPTFPSANPVRAAGVPDALQAVELVRATGCGDGRHPVCAHREVPAGRVIGGPRAGRGFR